MNKATRPITFLLVITLIITMASVSVAGTSYVNADVKVTSVNTFTQLEKAVSNAAIGDIINITGNIEFEHAIEINKSITINGQGKDKTILTVKDGGYRHFFTNGVDIPNAITVTMSGMTVRGPGTVSGNDIMGGNPDSVNGGLHSQFCTLFFSDMTFENNINRNNTSDSDDLYGGAINSWTSGLPNYPINIKDCIIQNNKIEKEGSGNVFGGGLAIWGTIDASNCKINNNVAISASKFAHGGGIYAGSSGSAIFNCYVSNNEVRSGGISPLGGGLYLKNGTIDNSIISGNKSLGTTYAAYGGGVYDEQALNINNCYIFDNEVQSQNSEADGGGVFTKNNLDANACTVEGNRAEEGIRGNGGGIYAGGNGYILNCTVNDNSIDVRDDAMGGGIYIQHVAKIINSTITNNEIASTNKSYGSGVYKHSNTSFDIINCTILNNTSESTSGSAASSIDENIASSINIKGSIITGNTSKDNSTSNTTVPNDVSTDIIATPTPTAVNGYNIVGYTPAEGYSAQDIFGTDSPTLAYNGSTATGYGRTKTVMLSASSTAIDKIPYTSYLTWVTGTDAVAKDQRGHSRPSPSEDNLVDIGAVEVQQLKDLDDYNLETFEITSDALNIMQGETIPLDALITPFYDTVIFGCQWESSNESIAKVDSRGLVTAKSDGTVTISATILGETRTVTIKVGNKFEPTPKPEPEPNPAPTPNQPEPASVAKTQTLSIKSAQKNIYLKKGQSATLPVMEYTNDGKKTALSYKTSNKKIATVAQSGKVNAKKKGKAVITVNGTNGKYYKFNIYVVNKVTKVKSIKVSGFKTKMKAGSTKTLKVAINPKKATKAIVTFKSSKPSVLSVDKSGKITAKKKGTAKITIKAGNKKKVIKINVK